MPCGKNVIHHRPRVRICLLHKVAARPGKWTVAAYRKVTRVGSMVPVVQAPCPYCAVQGVTYGAFPPLSTSVLEV